MKIKKEGSDLGLKQKSLRYQCRYYGLYSSIVIEMCCINPNQGGVSESLIRWGGGQWFYGQCFCILNIKNHIKRLYGHKSCPQQVP